MRTIRIFFLVAFAFIVRSAVAQTDTLRLNPNALNYLPQYVVYAIDSTQTSYVNDSIWLYNLSGNVFHDTVTLNYSINNFVHTSCFLSDSGMAFTGRTSYPIPSWDTLTIPPHDSILLGGVAFYFDTLTNGGAFSAGPNAVVIWPVAMHTLVYVPDSVSKTIGLYSNQDSFPHVSGITTPQDKKLRIYMFGQQLVVESDAQNPVTGVRIYTIDGTLLLTRAVEQNAAIPIDHLAAGIYFIDVQFKVNWHQTVKVLNMPER